MSDQKLRDLERRWKETGTVQDEAAYLLERVRVGDLTRERLELAYLQTTIGPPASAIDIASGPQSCAGAFVTRTVADLSNVRTIQSASSTSD